MVFRDYKQCKNIYWKYVPHETLEDYFDGIKIVQQQGYKIKAVVCDGKRGLLQSFGNIPVQMCQFHQVAIVTRYITKRSKIKAHRALLEVVYLMVKTDKESFVGALNDWHQQWKEYMNEQVFDEQTKKYRYSHHRLRSAYRSLITNLPFLFTWYDYYDLRIPNTTNSLEGAFTDLKNKIRVHAGLKKQRKQKLIDALLSR